MANHDKPLSNVPHQGNAPSPSFHATPASSPSHTASGKEAGGTAIPGSKADTEAALQRQAGAKETMEGKKQSKYAFRVLVGSHVHGGRLYSTGEVVELDTDLRKFNGPPGTQPKYQMLRGPEHPDDEEEPTLQTAASHQFPGGQVSDGLQETTSDPQGRPISGLKTKPNKAAEQGR